MYKYYNPHNGIITDDCVKRAICVCTGRDFSLVSKQLNAYKKVTGAKSFNSGKNPNRFVEDTLDAKKITLEAPISAKDFCKSHPRGRFILDMDGHWSSCVDGVIYDTWNTSDEKVNFAYEITTDGYKAPDIKSQVFRYCCTSEKISAIETVIRIYDGNGTFTERKIPTELTEGYVLCLQHSNYNYIKL